MKRIVSILFLIVIIGFAPVPIWPEGNGNGYDRVGSRNLKLGDWGKDVDHLIMNLMSSGYLGMDYEWKHYKDYGVFDTAVQNAVKHFQRDCGIKEDGIVTSEMLESLRVWDPLCSSISLGARQLFIEDETAGYDVDELVKLLISAGYSPQINLLTTNNPGTISAKEILGLSKGKMNYDKYQKRKKHYVFTENVKNALKVFQAFHGIKPTGDLNPDTISKLKSYNK